MPSQGSALQLLAKARINLYLDAKPQGTLFAQPLAYSRQNHRFHMEPKRSEASTEAVFNGDLIFPIERRSHYVAQQFVEFELPVLPEDSNLQYVDDVLYHLVEYVEIKVDHRVISKTFTSAESFLRARRENVDQTYRRDGGKFETEEERRAFSRGDGSNFKAFCRPLRFELTAWYHRWLSHALPQAKITASVPFVVLHLRPFAAVVECIDRSPTAEIEMPVAPRMQSQLFSVWYTVDKKQYLSLMAPDHPEHQYYTDATELQKEVLISQKNMKDKLKYTANHRHTQHLLFFQHAAHIEGNRPLASYIPVRWTTDVNRYRKEMPFELFNPRLNESMLHRYPPDEFVMTRLSTLKEHRNVYCSKTDEDAKPAVLTYSLDPDSYGPSGDIAFAAVAHNYHEYRLKGCGHNGNPLIGDATRALFLSPVREQKFRIEFSFKQPYTAIPLAFAGVYVDVKVNTETYRVLLKPGDNDTHLPTMGMSGAIGGLSVQFPGVTPAYDPMRFMNAAAKVKTVNGDVEHGTLFIPPVDVSVDGEEQQVFATDIMVRTLDETILPHTVCVSLAKRQSGDPVDFPLVAPNIPAGVLDDWDDAEDPKFNSVQPGVWPHSSVKALAVKCTPHHAIASECPMSAVPYRRNKPIAGGNLQFFARFRVPIVVTKGTVIRMVGGDERSV